MKYVVTGSTGNISKPLAEALIKAGHEVTIVSSNPEKQATIEAMGATAAIGNMEDIAFLTQTFSGADAVYTMVPPRWDATDWKAHIHHIGKNLATAVKAAGVKKVVNLSSVGAHMPEGCGPVSGLHFVEKEFDGLEGLDVRHLRPGYFYANLLGNIGMIRHMGIMGGNYGEQTKMVLVHTDDIARVAADELLNLNFTGSSVRYIMSDERTTTEIASVLGSAIGKPEIPWFNFKDEDTLQSMVQAGLSNEVAKNYVEMGRAIADGTMITDYLQNKPAAGSVKLEDFAQHFSMVFSHS